MGENNCNARVVVEEKLKVKMLWFEFILNPRLLTEYLVDKGPEDDGTVIDLIASFLSNARTASEIALPAAPVPPALPNYGLLGSGPIQTECPNTWSSPSPNPIGTGAEQMDLVPQNGQPVDEPTSQASPLEKKKFRALKLLALKVTAFLKWDLRILETKLPLHMQFLLFNELIKTLGSLPVLEVRGKAWEEMSEDLRFAHFTLHRWTLRIVVNGSYPTRQAKGISVHVPGQNDPTWAPPEATEGLLKKLREQCQQSIFSLEEFMTKLSEPNCDFDVRMPLPECFGILKEDQQDPSNEWEKGLQLKKEDVICQLAYDLGCMYFFNQQYSSAYSMFQQSNHFLQKLSKHNCVVSTLDKQKLEGYITGCKQALCIQDKDTPSSVTTASSTVAQLLQEMTKGSPEVLNILLDDNLKRKMPKSVRDRMEMDFIRQFGITHALYPKIAIANALRHAVEGDVILTDLRPYLSSPQNQDFFCSALKPLTDKATVVQKNLLQKFLQLLLADYKDLTPRCVKCGIMEPLFGTRNPKCLKVVKEKRITRVPRDVSFTQDSVAVMGRKERELLSTRRVDSVTSLVKQFHKMSDGIGKCATSATKLSKRWELPHFLEVLVRGLPSKDQEATYVLLAKAIEQRTSKSYEDARLMFRKIQSDSKDSHPKLYSTIQWELCHTDLLQFINDPLSHTYEIDNPKRQGALKQAISCLKSFMEGRDSILKNELVEVAALILLNCEEWSTLVELDVQRANPALEFSRLLASLCRNIDGPKSNRSAVREVWDVLIGLFNTSGQYKRSGSGSMKESYRDSHNGQYTKTMFQKFVRGLTGTSVLGIIISGIIRIYNTVKDESSQELSAEHQLLWPVSLGSNVHLNISSVGQLLQDLLHHALSAHPNHQSWLNSQADLMYIQGHFAAALKFYISAGASCSNFFSQPLPKYLFHDQQVKRMIQCCCKLQCHTQAAVLTQFLEEPNYTLSFKVLGERVCCDSCNSHYAHIWDVILLEFLVNLHARRGENDRRALAQQFLGLLELNANNNEEIQREAANIRKGKFLRAMAKQYL